MLISTKIYEILGHQRYLRTTLSGLTGYSPHYVMLVISANSGIVPMTQEHVGYAIALEVPFFIIMTKVDVTPKAKLQQTLDSLAKFLAQIGSKKVPLIVKNGDNLLNAVSNISKENVVPIFCVSSVSGTGLQEVKRFLHLLPPVAGLKEQEKLEQANPEFQIGKNFRKIFRENAFLSCLERVIIKYSHSHLSSHPSSHLKMPTKIEIDKILTPSNFDFYKKLTPDLEFCYELLTPGCL